MFDFSIDKLLQTKMSRRQFLQLGGVAVASIFGVAGIIKELRSHAATIVATKEAESGTLGGNAKTSSDSGASGGQAVVFSKPGGSTAGNGRDTLVLGTYKPGADTTGIIPGIALTDVTAATVYTQIGTAASPYLVENKRFLNKVSINGGQYITFKNCSFNGPPAGATIAAALSSTNFNNKNLVFEDCLFTQQAPTSENCTGIQGGHNSTFLRCEFKGTGDGIALVHSQGTWANAHDGPMNLTVLGCYFHDLAYFSPEPGRSPSDNASHCDCIQIRGGSNIIIRYNTFVAHLNPAIGAASKPSVDGTDSSGNPIHISGNKFYPDLNATSALMVSPYLAPFHDVYVENNWIDGGSVSINLAQVGTTAGADTNFNIKNNKWGRSMRLGEQATIIGVKAFQNSGELHVTGNAYEDNGVAINSVMNG